MQYVPGQYSVTFTATTYVTKVFDSLSDASAFADQILKHGFFCDYRDEGVSVAECSDIHIDNFYDHGAWLTKNTHYPFP